MSYKKQQIILQIVTSALQRCRVKASGRGPTSSAKWTRYPHRGHSAQIHSQKKTTNKPKNRQTKNPEPCEPMLLGRSPGKQTQTPMTEKTHETKLPEYLRLHL